jgi:hypothetical protein
MTTDSHFPRGGKPMKKKIQLPIIIGMIVSICFADKEAPNDTTDFTDITKEYHILSIPIAPFSHDKGITKVFKIDTTSKKEVLVNQYEWYSRELFAMPIKDTLYLVRKTQWHRGKDIDEDALELGFYKAGKVIREYRLKEIALNINNVTKSTSHYRIIKQVKGFKKAWVPELGEKLVFVIITEDNRMVVFDVYTGEMDTKN